MNRQMLSTITFSERGWEPCSSPQFRYLRPMRPLYQRLDALDAWQAIVEDLRRRYLGCKVLMEMLDTL